MTIPFTRPSEWPPSRPGRFAETILTAPAQGCPIALLGLPDDTGVRLNGGRPGAAEGPRAFRAALASFGGTFDLASGQPLQVRVLDAGDVEPAPGAGDAALLETHQRVEAAARALHQAGCMTIGIGGGHDLALPCIAAWARHRGHAVGGINLDAHLDVRERIGSGMPFRRLITGGHVDPRAFVELGLGRFANDRGDVEWARSEGATLVTADDVLRVDDVSASPLPSVPSLSTLLAQALAPGAGFVSIDLDGIDAAFAPGVSAPNPLGLGVGYAARLAEMAGADPRVGHFDIMELCPPHDQQGRTARVAALLFLSFLAGWRARPA
jgi:formimidoylglutamase